MRSVRCCNWETLSKTEDSGSGRGYWAKKEAGKSVKQKPLPRFENPPTIYYRKHVRQPKPQIDSADPELARIAAVESKAVLILDFEHNLIVRARPLLQKARTDEYGRIVHPPSSSCADIHVSKEMLARALSIMNAVVFALEAEELKVTVTGESTSIEVFGQRVSFGILEDLQIKERHEVKSYSGTKRVNV